VVVRDGLTKHVETDFTPWAAILGGHEG